MVARCFFRKGRPSSLVGRESQCKFNPAMLFRLLIIVANSPVTNFPKSYYGINDFWTNNFSRYFCQFQSQNQVLARVITGFYLPEKKKQTNPDRWICPNRGRDWVSMNLKWSESQYFVVLIYDKKLLRVICSMHHKPWVGGLGGTESFTTKK